jgi:hypothetical protein
VSATQRRGEQSAESVGDKGSTLHGKSPGRMTFLPLPFRDLLFISHLDKNKSTSLYAISHNTMN